MEHEFDIEKELLRIHEVREAWAVAKTNYGRAAEEHLQAANVLETMRLIKVMTGEIAGKNETERTAKTQEVLMDEIADERYKAQVERGMRLSLDLAGNAIAENRERLNLLGVLWGARFTDTHQDVEMRYEEK